MWFLVWLVLKPICWMIDRIQYSLYGDDTTKSTPSTYVVREGEMPDQDLADGPPSLACKLRKIFRYKWKLFCACPEFQAVYCINTPTRGMKYIGGISFIGNFRLECSPG